MLVCWYRLAPLCGLRIRERRAKVHGTLIYVDFSSVERASIELAACVRFHLFCQAFYARPLTAHLVGGRKGLACYAVLMEAVQSRVVFLLPSKYLQALPNGPCLVFGLTTSALLKRGKS